MHVVQLIQLQIFCILTIRFLKSYVKIKLKWIQMVLYDHRSIEVLDPRVLIPATENVIKPQHYRIYSQKTDSCFWSVNYIRSKITFLCSGNKLQIFKYPPFDRTLCIDTHRINFVYSKNGIARQYCISLEKKLKMILEHI